jgi:hypothetical protein
LVLEKKAIPNREELAGVYILENTPPGGRISADVIWGKKYEKAKRKWGKIFKKKEERGEKMRKREVKG